MSCTSRRVSRPFSVTDFRTLECFGCEKLIVSSPGSSESSEYSPLASVVAERSMPLVAKPPVGEGSTRTWTSLSGEPFAPVTRPVSFTPVSSSSSTSLSVFPSSTLTLRRALA